MACVARIWRMRPVYPVRNSGNTSLINPGMLPPDANDAPAVCMGDARIVNCLITGVEARALIDFEVAYIGNPAADIGYSLFTSGNQRENVPSPLRIKLQSIDSFHEPWIDSDIIP